MKLRKVVVSLLAVCCVVVLGACAPEENSKKFKIALLIPNQGDQSFYDLSVAGIKLVEKELGKDVDASIIEIGNDESKWESQFVDAAEGGYDVILSCNWQISPYMYKVAKKYPDQKFINFDIEEASELKNVYSMFYKTNELGYLAGVAAASTTVSDMEFANPEAVIGFVGGMDIPGINDFLVGYIEGAKSVKPDIKVSIAYANDFADVAKAKELALSQYNSGADVIFQAAGNAGNGVIDAAADQNKYVIGVDSDQAMAFKDKAENKANKIITSGYKTIDKTILDAVKKAKDGKLKYGTHNVYGVKEAGVGLAKNEYYEKLTSDSVKKAVEKAEKDLQEGTIKVSSAFTMKEPEINDLKQSVKP